MHYSPTLLFCFFLLLDRELATAIDILNTTQAITDGDTMVSADGTYVLGFFSPGKSKYRYLGIRYGKIPVPTVVWVANRETPLKDSSGVLRLTNKGILILLDRRKSVFWSSNTTRLTRNPTAQLLDSGNLAVKEEGDNNLENSLWQSFEHPTDTLLPDMKLGRNRITGMNLYMTSWKSADDPSRGNFTCMIDSYRLPELVVMEDSKVKYRSGPWNGQRFSGVPYLNLSPLFTYEFVFSEKEMFFRYHGNRISSILRIVVSPNGDILGYMWIEKTQSWLLMHTAKIDNCDSYALCGANGICSIHNSPVCDCLNGFVPKTPREWHVTDWSNGCVRRTPLSCSGDGFRMLSRLKLPETKTSWFNKSMNLEECKNSCLKNCSCTAYSNLDIRNGGSGCVLWFGDLIDIRAIDENKQEVYVRMAESELDNGDGAKINTKSIAKKRILTSTVLCAGILCLGLALVFCVWKKQQQKSNVRDKSYNSMHKKELELPFFDLGTLACATNNFSTDSKLGEGGFGPVYKGILADGREIAVKRLSKNSRQGLKEFKNEANYIVKLQHRNLVKLLGCCIEEDEKMLIYEFLPNKSLDFLIFDFGLARSFGGNETEANTNKVAGTYGYISPEYANHGLYSLNSDVFSFGVLVLEIISGNRNRGFLHPDHNLNLLGHAWRLFKEKKPLELAAESLVITYNSSEVIRSIHVGLLCVQENPEDRPNMSNVVLMLGNEDELLRPKQPGFFTERDLIEATHSSSLNKPCSANKCFTSELEPR